MRHIRPGALRVLVYDGQGQPGDAGKGSAARVYTAADLAAAGALSFSSAASSHILCTVCLLLYFAVMLSLSMRVAPPCSLSLGAADIVLTTYDVLRRDLNHRPDADAEPRQLRRRKRYEVG